MNEKEKELSTLSGADVIKLITTLQRENNVALTEALSKLSPSYKTPEQVESSEQLKQTQRKIEKDKLSNTRRRQKNCEHETGQNGRMRTGEGAFYGLKLPTGETIGVCAYCQAVISSANPDHQKYFRKINGTVAEAGQFGGLTDPTKSQLARLNPDERAHVQELRNKYFVTTPVQTVSETEPEYF